MSLNLPPQVDHHCNNIYRCRTLQDIVWGCLVTVFACTWVSVYPNVPPPGRSKLKLVLRRLGTMLMTAMAPEVTMSLAARQFIVARRFSRDFNLSRVHGFFFSMGGFISRTGHPITTMKQLQAADYIRDIRALSIEDIMDRSKGDALSKGIALLQCLWFVVQCTARLAQQLPITQLEIATLAYTSVNVFTSILWWNKPLDVQCAIPIGPQIESGREGGEDSQCKLSTLRNIWELVFLGPASGAYPGYKPDTSNAVPSFWATDSHIFDSSGWNVKFISGIMFGAIHCIVWNAQFPSKLEATLWKTCSIYIAAFMGTLLFHMGYAIVLFAPETKGKIGAASILG
ncbi:hypothetical protein C8J56DRAFT_1090228 [Mycena floridula]|nr:hypothetical protein C8J56DRAFT_1090228 [Mycena floridula]